MNLNNLNKGIDNFIFLLYINITTLNERNYNGKETHKN